jgi:hypothetical protein
MVDDEADRWVGYRPLLKNAIWFVVALNPSRGYEGLQVTSRSSLATDQWIGLCQLEPGVEVGEAVLFQDVYTLELY